MTARFATRSGHEPLRNAKGAYLRADHNHNQKVAMGLNGDPVPPSTGNGATVNRNVQRFLAAAALATASRSRLSRMGAPIATSVRICTGIDTPSMFDGMASIAKSLPSAATFLALNQGMQVASKPAEPFETFHSPSAAYRAQRPASTSTASPLWIFTPVFFSQASRSSG